MVLLGISIFFNFVVSISLLDFLSFIYGVHIFFYILQYEMGCRARGP